MCVKKQGVAGTTVTVVETPGWDRVSVKCTVPKEALRKRKRSLDVPPDMSGEEQERKEDPSRRKVDLEVVRDGYTEAGMAVMKHYAKPLFMIMTTIVAASIGAIAGAQHGSLGACLGIVVGVIISVVLSYAVREAATAERDILSTPVQTKYRLL